MPLARIRVRSVASQCLPDNLDLLRSQYAPCARRLSVRYVVQSALVHPPKPLPHGRVRPHQQISYPAYAALIFLRSMLSGCPLPSPVGRLQSSSGESVCLYRARNHCLLAGYRICSIRVRLRSSCVFVIGESIKTFRFGLA